MIDERHEELASLYALDLLEGPERAQFETTLARDPQLQTLVRELREATAAVVHTAPVAPPPAALRERVMASIAPARVAMSDNVVRGPFSELRTLVPWAIAAGFAVVAGWGTLNYFHARMESELLRDQNRLAELARESTRQQLEATTLLNARQITSLGEQLAAANIQVGEARQRVVELAAELKSQGDLANLKIAALASMLNNSPQALAVAVWDPQKQEGLLSLEKMPPLESGQKLELWVVEAKPGAKPVSAGVLAVSGEAGGRMRFKPTVPVTTLAAFAMSREKDDGAAFHAAPAEVIMSGPSR